MDRLLRAMKVMSGTLRALAVLLAALGLASPASAQRGTSRPGADEPAAQKYFTDVPLVDQHGTQRRLYTDLLKNKIVVINVMFTACGDSCPLMAGTFAKLQDYLGDRLGKDVYLLSFSVDPENDSPARLRAYADKLRAKPGWFFLTGKKQNVDFALYKLGQRVDRKEDHLNLFLMGNDRTGLWKKVFGLSSYGEIVKALESVINDKG